MEMLAQEKMNSQRATKQAFLDAERAIQQEETHAKMGAQAAAEAEATRIAADHAEALRRAQEAKAARLARDKEIEARIKAAAKAKAEAEAVLFTDRARSKVSKFTRPPEQADEAVQLVRWLNVDSGQVVPRRDPDRRKPDVYPTDVAARVFVALVLPCLRAIDRCGGA